MRQYKIIVEKHPDGCVAYPLGLRGVIENYLYAIGHITRRFYESF
jgi:hypothetical protein